MSAGIFESATSLARSIRNRECSAAEVVEAHLRRIETVNPAINAVCLLTAERAMDAARKSDAAIAHGDVIGPLHGVPMTLKDNLDVAGVVTTGGTVGRKNFVPGNDATVFRKLREAGAILLGRTTTPEFTMAYETANLLHGRVNHPQNPELSAGGSSGGAAAIVSTGGSPFDIGSDTGGSIRVPSHFCGISGLKTTDGRISKAGHIVSLGCLVDRMTQLGPMARTVEDLEMLLPILSGADHADPSTAPAPPCDSSRISPGALRVGCFLDNGISKPAADISDAMRQACTFLSDSGARVGEVALPGVDECFDLTLSIWTADGGAAFRTMLAAAGTTEVSPFLQIVLGVCESRKAADAAAVNQLLMRWSGFRARMLEAMSDIDILVSPVCPFTAVPHGSTFGDEHFPGFSHTMLHNLTGWPATSIPVTRTSTGLPIGVQIAARPWHEDLVLTAARCIEARAGFRLL